MIHPFLCFYTAFYSNDYIGTHLIWMELPLTALTMFLTFVMQPKKNSTFNKVLLAVHYFTYTVLSEIMRCVWDPSVKQLIFSIGRSIAWTMVYRILMEARRR